MSDQTFAAPVKRGCGSRKKGGTYWETPFSEQGQPIEHFFRCPPPRFDAEKFGLGFQGIQLWEVEGVTHALDWIGSMDYPNPADFLEEARRFGVSRRFELSSSQYEKITKDSQLICVHGAGHIVNTMPHWIDRIGMQHEFFGSRYRWEFCPKHVPEHEMNREDFNIKLFKGDSSDPMCCGLWWEDVSFAEPVEKDSRLAFRTMPSFKYRCIVAPKEGHKHEPAVIGVFPLGRIVVVEDPDENTHDDKLKKLEVVADVRVDLVKE